MADARVVAVTGAARGIGLAIAAELAGRGCRVALGDLREEDAQRAAEEIGHDAIGLALDVSDRESFERFLEAVEGRLGSLDVLVNNAGIMTVGPLESTKPGAASKTIDVNLKGMLFGTQLAAPRLHDGGQIVNVVSSAAWVAPPALAAYSASKHAARALSDAVRGELGKRGVTVTAVYPGLVQTDLAMGTKPARGQKMIPPEKVAKAVARAIDKRQPEVFVPRSLGRTLRIYAALPPRSRAFADRVFGISDLYTEVDPESRRAYEDSLGTG